MGRSLQILLVRVFSLIASLLVSLMVFGAWRMALPEGQLLPPALGSLTAGLLLWYFLNRHVRRRRRMLREPFPEGWRRILGQDVAVYGHLDEEERLRFEGRIQLFLATVPVRGVDLKIDDRIRVLAAASAAFPVLRFPEWEYPPISEVLVYANAFNESFETSGGRILGMVGMGDAVLLSAPDLLSGFARSRDRQNVGFHEFLHKVDQADGTIDGLPAALADRSTLREWKIVMEQETAALERGDSDINPYALTNEAEFFAVTGEYFFENPARMEREHPELYRVMKKIFRQDMKALLKKAMRIMVNGGRGKIGRNAPCPCGSGKKFKYCCLGKEG